MMVRISMAITLLAVGALLHWLARDREGRLFMMALGRPLSVEDHARARRLRLINAVCVLVAVAVVLATTQPVLIIIAELTASLLPAAYMIVAVARSVRETPLPPVPGKYLVPMGGRPTLRELISPPLHFLNFAVLAAGVVTYLLALRALPGAIPMHWNISGEVDRWASPGEMWIMLAISLFDTSLFLWFCWTAARERWVLPLQEPERYAVLQVEKRRLMVRMLEKMMVAINATMLVIGLGLIGGGLIGSAQLGGLIALIFAPLSTVIMLIVVASSMTRLAELSDQLRAIAKSEALGTRPSGWRWGGMIYYSREDPATFVPKRSGIGQTLNFARPTAWLFLGGVVLLPMVIALFAGHAR